MKLKALWFAWILIIVVGVISPSPSNSGSKSYDFRLLLNKPHPFTTRENPRPPKTHIKRYPTSKASNAVTVFGGWMTDNNFEEVFTPWELEFRDSTLFGIAASHRIWRYADKISLEIEGQVVRHFGNQDHWEFNLPLIARWEKFPWNDVIDTSVAFGLGPSYATEVPKEEVANKISFIYGIPRSRPPRPAISSLPYPEGPAIALSRPLVSLQILWHPKYPLIV